MLFRRPVLERIAAGEVTLAFRRWRRPTIRAGGMLTTPIGVLAIDAVDISLETAVTDAEARQTGESGRDALLAGLGPASDGAALYRITFRRLCDDPREALRKQADLGADDEAELRRRLDRLDQTSRHGAWTRAILQRIAAAPGLRAGNLAEEFGRETLAFKADVRKLKALGLTESLDIGYRLSPRGRALLDRMEADGC